MQKINIEIEQLSHFEGLDLPRYMTSESAGMDLVAAVIDEVILDPMEIKLIPTGLKMAIPSGYEAQIRPRSGLALKYGISLPNSPGTIDADYRGEIGIIMQNLGQEPFVVRRGERIAQLVVAAVVQGKFEVVSKLSETARGTGGFGSTGK